VTAGGRLKLPEFVALAARAGFKAVDFSIAAVADMAKKESVEKVKEMFGAAGIRPGAFGLTVEWRKDEAQFRQGLVDLAEKAKLAGAIGAKVCCGGIPCSVAAPREEFMKVCVERFKGIAATLGAEGIAFAIEFIGPQTSRKEANVTVYDLNGCMEVVTAVGGPNAGVLIDSFHWHTGGCKWSDLDKVPGEKIMYVHINDAPDRPLDKQQDMQRLLPGEGVIELPRLLRALQKKGYAGCVSVEVFNNDLKKLDPDIAANAARVALAKVLAKV
jgi:sugar phosphate isomerase/epimerase